MVNMGFAKPFRTSHELVDSEAAQILLASLGTVKKLPGVIKRQRQTGYGTTEAYSAGKPWFKYEACDDSYDPNSERLRVRVAERWFGNSSAKNPHGTVSVMQQVIFMRSLTEPEQQIVASGEKSALLLQSTVDESVMMLTKIAFMATGQVVGNSLRRRDGSQPYAGGYEPALEADIKTFNAQQRLYEEEYRASALTTHDVLDLHKGLVAFAANEQALSALRMPLRS